MNPSKISLSSPDIGEEEIDAAVRVLQSGRLSLGHELELFEQEMARYVGTKYAVAVSSGTAGLHCVVRALGIKEGDEVITSPFSFIASANCILFERAKPVFVDVDPHTLCFDAEKIEEKITPRTKAILAVHILGVPCQMDRIQQIAKGYNLFVIEDACEAIGAEWNGQKVGSIGNAGVFAFYPNKQMTTGEGGVIVTDDKWIADICKSLRNQGRSLEDGNAFERLGYNYRLSEIHAALGRVQLVRIQDILEKRRQVAQWYAAEFEGCKELILPPGISNPKASWFIFLVQLHQRFSGNDRDFIRTALGKKGIETGAYFSPIHLQRFYRDEFGYQAGDFPITESIAQRTIALPFYNDLNRNQIKIIKKTLLAIMGRVPSCAL